MNRKEISERTRFDRGPAFKNQDELTSFFTVKHLDTSVGRAKWAAALRGDDYILQNILDEMAETVFYAGWHCDFETEDGL